MAREWRHLKLLKRAGRAYDPLGVANTPPGSLAIICRACPQQGLNLPPDWDTQDPSKRCVLHHLLSTSALTYPTQMALHVNSRYGR